MYPLSTVTVRFQFPFRFSPFFSDSVIVQSTQKGRFISEAIVFAQSETGLQILFSVRAFSINGCKTGISQAANQCWESNSPDH